MDKGRKKYLRTSSASRILALKVNCKIIVIRNLENGLVNGLTGTVTDIRNTEISVKIDKSVNLNHKMEGKTFTITPVDFIERDVNGQELARRIQLPIKLGYATTVDKVQGRTIPSLVVDSYNFWKPSVGCDHRTRNTYSRITITEF